MTMLQAATPRRRRSIYFSASAYAQYLQTVGRHPPETYALLGGYLDKAPFRITDLRFCPPQRRPGGGYDASSSHLNIDHDYLNFVVDREWRPVGKDMLGIIHSHPGDLTSLSHGASDSNTGDIVFFSSCIANDDSPNRNWEYFLAPITTFRPDGSDCITGWLLRRGASTPLPCDVIIETGHVSDPPPLTLADLRVEITRDLLVRYTVRIGPLCRDPHIEHRDRQAKLDEFSRLADPQLRADVPGHYLLSKVIFPDEAERS